MTGPSLRTTVAVPYEANAVPKGARNSRSFVFRASVPIEIEIVRNPATAVLCRDERARETVYLGHDASLWLPVAASPNFGGHAIAAEDALRRLTRGLGFCDGGHYDNPFLHVADGRLKPGDFAAIGPIEDAALRSVESTGLAAAGAAARRLARDFLLTEDGRLLRRSVGPFWGQYTQDDLSIIPFDFKMPSGPDMFACTRVAEAMEFRAREHPRRSMNRRGMVDILEPGCVPDHDAHVAARSVLRTECAAWMADVAPLASASVALLAEQAQRGYERVHGRRIADLSHKDRRTLPAPASAVPPTPEQIVEAVDAMRLFVTEMPGSHEDEEILGVCDNWRSVYEDLAGRAIRRFDAFERHRLPDPEGVPQIDSAPSASA
ncbi:hypothetical protein BHAOGJBA_4242 [Methylobacterium hispanicum]|uniref:Uncharacterized protein n=1 Tax=Methylobacterium hispanicum TaxID=270350 RepID=A0AAV4ZRT6_9HYPH|nr:hypothetical protein [Methylobacterium hispanicum]GJD90700.1 hypothetical protein BHAOGJBA_4242 [Methylobacterium hispanicum]